LQLGGCRLGRNGGPDRLQHRKCKDSRNDQLAKHPHQILRFQFEKGPIRLANRILEQKQI
jgi:hypothetical protein